MPARKAVQIGDVFERLTVVARESPKARSRGQQYFVRCKCECGEFTVVDEAKLRIGSTRSCGCLARDLTKERSVTHGLRRTAAYQSWASMVQRCKNANNPSYSKYGGAGIEMCDRWSGFESFYADMGERPDGTTLDRIDNSLGYYPGNCRWATNEEQMENRRVTRTATIGGETKTVKSWCKEVGMNYWTAMWRINQLGWSPEKALMCPLMRPQKKASQCG